MSELRPFPVVLENGETATMYATARFLDDRQERLVRTKDGREFLIPKSALTPRSDGAFELRVPISELDRYGRTNNPPPPPEQHASGSQQLREPTEGGAIPVIEEDLEVSKHEHEIGRVRIHKSVETRDAQVEEPLLRREYQVERVTVDRMVDSTVDPWYDGDTLVLPIYEEVLVIEKRLVLREEVRITRHTQEQMERKTIPVRREHVDIERVG